MTTHTNSIACPQCGKYFFFTAHRTIDLSKNPELKAKAQSGALFTLHCPHCHHQAVNPDGFIYLDPTAKVLVHCAVTAEHIQATLEKIHEEPALSLPDDTDEAVKTALKEKPETYAIRVVTSLPDFQEKLAIWDSGFDDRVMELVKMMFASQVQSQGVSFDHVFFVKGQGTKPHAIQFFDSASGKSQGVWINDRTRSVYDALEKQFASLLSQHARDVVVNSQWAIEIINEMSQKTNYN
ncbi:MAG: CpXC domain-containing protein [Burkholderiaceae bacterium]|nr:CpXC domain-containing protein [Burkholderiaceae bacterium]